MERASLQKSQSALRARNLLANPQSTYSLALSQPSAWPPTRRPPNFVKNGQVQYGYVVNIVTVDC